MFAKAYMGRKRWAQPFNRFHRNDDQMPNEDTDHALESTILELLTRRGPGKTICPSDAARVLDPDGWQELMEPARAAARRLVEEGRIVITQRGKIVDPAHVKGPIRLKIR
jgi:hypothetical protein